MSTADRSPDLTAAGGSVSLETPTRRGLARQVAKVNDAEVAATIGVGGIVVASLLSTDHIENGPVLCIFRRLTGLPCPGCGLTRSWVYLMHGDFEHSFTSNPFGAVLIVGVVLLAISVVRARVTGRPAPSLEAVARKRPVQVLFAAWLVFGVVRLVYVALT